MDVYSKVNPTEVNGTNLLSSQYAKECSLLVFVTIEDLLLGILLQSYYY